MDNTLSPSGRMRPLFFLLAVVFLILIVFAANSHATTSGVPGPGVREGERAFEYRGNFSPSEGNRAGRFDHRFHYQQAINDRLRLRAIAQYADPNGQDSELQFTRLEAVWNFRKSVNGSADGLRLDIQNNDSSRNPDFVRLIFVGDRKIGQINARYNILLGKELGDRARSGLTAGTRFEFTANTDSGLRYGLQYLNSLGTTSDFGSFDEQSHQIGPVFSKSFGKWGVFGSYLTGLSDASPDHAIRFWLTRSIR